MASDIGIYGLGTMGRALALNFAENGFRVSVTNREADWIADFLTDAGALAEQIEGHTELADFIASLASPRVILFMIPSGAPMDTIIQTVMPLLAEGDTIIDGGNADFNDTRRRFAMLQEKGVHFVGLGVSGGQAGARSGPSMMVGGTAHSWTQIRPMLEAISAKFEGSPCVAHLGPDGAGHFVKTVHNGIEYADMQMIAEIYGVLRDGAGWDAARIGRLMERWNEGVLGSYLIEISAKALQTTDPDTGLPMVDVILDKAGQKGTGRWTVIEALKMGQSASAIEAAVGARAWSSEKDLRAVAEDKLMRGRQDADVPALDDLEMAMLAGRILAHAQGFQVLTAASKEFDWDLDMALIARIWRAGCIIRSVLLDEFSDAFSRDLPGDHLILAPSIRAHLARALPGLRRVVAAGALKGHAVPSLCAALAWHDTMARERGTSNLIQAQRDVFGRHGFARLDKDGLFRADWG